MCNGEFRRMLQGGDTNKVLSLAEIGIAGSMAGTVMAFFNCPIELLKVKLQTQDPAGIIGVNGKLEPPVSFVVNACLYTNWIHFSIKVLLIVAFVLCVLKDR